MAPYNLKKVIMAGDNSTSKKRTFDWNGQTYDIPERSTTAGSATKRMPEADSPSIANTLGGMVGKARDLLRGRGRSIDASVDDATHVNYGGNPGSSIRGRADSGHDD
jgi:hypothetical protein